MKNAKMKASDRVTPSDITSPQMKTYDDKIKVTGGKLPPEKKIEAIASMNLPSGRSTAPDSVGF